ncbi:GGDEF domain-containing protein [Brevibacillus agri]|uniref:GGDEF domain-containing protein n=1 Tax=Brevibacillus TaxID=55080 RepID=UPI001D0AE063|nr:GGDEF domain-containing protein [Brevibacillus borstelensis]MCC0566250.1 GGDEF domain-containing protein [Brevibacillus borstelensis]MED1854788.1 GGDEF domain-containing protein [Brevibacillus borstelensis]
MGYSGRIVTSISVFFTHSFYIVYYYYRDGKVEALDLYSFPFLIIFAYWAGKQYDKVKYLSDKDTLTGVYTRRFVLNTFEKITSLANRTNSKLFVLIIDCDNFKEINDRHGHDKGDIVLTKIGETLVGSTRRSDIVARWGGDEFLVIGHLKEEPDLQTVLQRLDNDMRNLSNQINLSVKVSIGSAIYPDDCTDLNKLIKSADENMYRKKLHMSR